MATTTLAGIIPTHAAATALQANPTTPPFTDDQQWITAYLTIHMMSSPSYRVTYLLWFAIAFVFIVVSVMHYIGAQTSFIGAYWSKWALRRRTWRKKYALAVARKRGQSHRQPYSLPSNAQLLSLLFVVVVALVLSFVGPDYIAPQVGVFNFINDAPIADLKRRATYDPSQFVQYQPQYTISKAWWTVGGRHGLVAFALFPLCVLLALKSAPFALFSIPFTAQIQFDKLACIHRWTGRLIWFITAIHVAAWSVQLAKDSRQATNLNAYTYAWQYPKFIYGWIAFVLLTLIMICSIRPIRQSHYEAFYFLHILLVPLMLVMSALHHPPVQWWAFGALGVWICERLWRAVWWLNTNGYFGGITANGPISVDLPVKPTRHETFDMKNPKTFPAITPFTPTHVPFSSQSTSATLVNRNSTSTVDQLISPPTTYVPPPGYAHAELMPGRTVRLKFVTPGYRSWSPGQHFLLSIPSVSRFTSHPFTVASICDETSTSDSGRVLVFLIRAKGGWTKDLWDTIVGLMVRRQNTASGETIPKGSHTPTQGVLIRAFVEGPLGSVSSTNWNNHSTMLIVVGGSGVSFGLSILEYACLCLSGRDGKQLGGASAGFGRANFKVSRVRFVWLVREFCHIQWCASILRRCMSLVHSPELQLDIFVTNIQPSRTITLPAPHHFSYPPSAQPDSSPFTPPVARFAEVEEQPGSPDVSDDEAYGGLVDLSYYTSGGVSPKDEETGWDDGGGHELDLTNFDGDDDTQLPGEAQLSYRFKKEGIMRRAKSRRVARARTIGRNRRPDSPDSDDTDDPKTSTYSRRTSTNSTANLISHHDSDVIAPRWGSTSRPILEVDIASVGSSTPWVPSPLSSSRSSTVQPKPNSRLTTHSYSHEDVPLRRAQSPFGSASDVDSVYAMMPQTGVGAYGEEVKIEFDEREIYDVSVVAEHARPGRPKLDRLLAEEVTNSRGSVIVACCGPTSLNAVVRKYVAAQIDPGRIRRGDMRGSITLISEDFEY